METLENLEVPASSGWEQKLGHMRTQVAMTLPRDPRLAVTQAWVMAKQSLNYKMLHYFFLQLMKKQRPSKQAYPVVSCEPLKWSPKPVEIWINSTYLLKSCCTSFLWLCVQTPYFLPEILWLRSYTSPYEFRMNGRFVMMFVLSLLSSSEFACFIKCMVSSWNIPHFDHCIHDKAAIAYNM